MPYRSRSGRRIPFLLRGQPEPPPLARRRDSQFRAVARPLVARGLRTLLRRRLPRGRREPIIVQSLDARGGARIRLRGRPHLRGMWWTHVLLAGDPHARRQIIPDARADPRRNRDVESVAGARLRRSGDARTLDSRARRLALSRPSVPLLDASARA